jgi:hypothetical protein
VDHDEKGVYLYRERFVLANRNARMLFLLLWMILHLFSPLSIASKVIGSPSIDAYEGGDEADSGGDNMEPFMASNNEYPNIPENGSEFSMAQENDTQNSNSTQIPPKLPR